MYFQMTLELLSQIYTFQKLLFPDQTYWANYDGLKNSMLHLCRYMYCTRFKGHMPFGSGEEEFEVFLPYTYM